MKKNKKLDFDLFFGIEEGEYNRMLACLSMVKKEYQKGEYIFHMGDEISSLGLVAQGCVQIQKEDYWGERQILGIAEEGQLFGESYACTQGEPLLVNVLALEPSRIYFLDVKRVFTVCSSACAFHTRLIQNLLTILSKKNLMLTQKIEHMGQKTIREKVLSYLSFQASKQGTQCFEIPFNRQQLADYLAVDRSALSAELSRMQREGLLSYERSRFTLR